MWYIRFNASYTIFEMGQIRKRKIMLFNVVDDVYSKNPHLNYEKNKQQINRKKVINISGFYKIQEAIQMWNN